VVGPEEEEEEEAAAAAAELKDWALLPRLLLRPELQWRAARLRASPARALA
jgi:hypothetical protein